MFGYHKYLDARLAQKADHNFVIQEFAETKTEIGRLKDMQAKVFDQMRENEQRAQDRHERLMEKLPR